MIPESDRLARMLLGRLARYRRSMWQGRLKSRRGDPEYRLLSRRTHEDAQYTYSVASATYKRYSKMPKYSQETV